MLLPRAPTHAVSGSVTLARKGASGIPILFSGYVDGFFQKTPGQQKTFAAALVEQVGAAPVPAPHLSGNRLSSEDPKHQAFSPSLDDSCHLSPAGRQVHRPRFQAHSLTRSGHKCQQRAVALSISSSVINRLL